MNGVHGLLVLPDEWELPAGCRLTFGAKGWDENSYEESQWEKMENAGAVLLPAAAAVRSAAAAVLLPVLPSVVELLS